MVVRAGANEIQERFGAAVRVGDTFQLIGNFHLGQGGGEHKLREAVLFRDLGKKIFDFTYSDGLKHHLHIFLGVGCEHKLYPKRYA